MPRRAALLALLACLATGPAEAQSGSVIVGDAAYPEGPLWHEGALYYAEMTRDRVMRYRDRSARVFWSEPGCGPTAIAPYGGVEEGRGFVVLCHLGARLAILDEQGGFQRWIEADSAGRPLVDPNDAGADGRGGVYFSDPGRFGPQPEPQGAVLYLASDGTVTRVAEKLRYANGVTLDRRGGRLLVSEHIGRRIWAYPVLGPGRLGPGRILLDLTRYLTEEELGGPLSGPDGLEIDRAGRLFFAVYGTGRLMMLDAAGRLATVARLPEPYITNLSIDQAGRRLFVTAARDNRIRPYPGRVLQIPLPPD